MGLFKKVWDAMKDTANELKNQKYIQYNDQIDKT